MKNIALIFVLLMITGCLAPPSSPALHDFGAIAVNPVQPLTGNALIVTASEWLNNNDIHYRLLYSSATELRAYRLDRWIAPLPQLLARQLQTTLNLTACTLTLNVLTFEQQFMTPKDAKLVFAFTALAFSNDGKTLLGSRSFNLSQASSSGDAKGSVIGLIQLSQKAAVEINKWLKQLVQQPKESTLIKAPAL